MPNLKIDFDAMAYCSVNPYGGTWAVVDEVKIETPIVTSNGCVTYVHARHQGWMFKIHPRYHASKRDEPFLLAHDGMAWVQVENPFYLPPLVLRTQKARGVKYLSEIFGSTVPPFQVAQTEEQARKHVAEMQDSLVTHAKISGGKARKVFFRPCPVRPRHGFVDSRVVATPEDAVKVFQEALAADPDCEALIMPAIDATQSAVLTPNTISVGAGHDGVTGGRVDTITFPLAHADFSWVNKEKAAIKESPYLESVYDQKALASGVGSEEYGGEGQVLIVQLRDGPAVTCVAQSAYVMKDVTVTQIWRAEGDLLEWETKVKDAPEGTAVHSPGGSMLSHYAVHAVMRGLPILFTEESPKVGDMLRANVSAPKVPYYQITRGLAYGLTKQVLEGEYTENVPSCGISDCETCPKEATQCSFGPLRLALQGAVLATHQVSGFQQSEDGCIAIGSAVGFMLRAATAACLGEARHARRIGVVAEGVSDELLKAVQSSDRDKVYTKSLSSYRKSRGLLQDAYRLFRAKGWGGSFGGKNWANVTKATIQLDIAARRFAAKQGKGNYSKLIASLHVLVNAVHNGGSWFNKFINASALNAGACGDVRFILRASYALRPIVLEARKLKGRAAPEELAQPLTVPQMPKDKAPKVRRKGQFKVKEGYLLIQYGCKNRCESAKVYMNATQQKAVLETLKCVVKEESFTSDLILYYPINADTLALLPAAVSRSIRAQISGWKGE